MSPEQVACFTFAISATVSGWFVVRGSTLRRSGSVLFGVGVVSLFGCAAWVSGASVAAHLALMVVGFVLLPAALLLYPRVHRGSAVTFSCLVTALGAGGLAVLLPVYREPAGYVVTGSVLVHLWWQFERGDEQTRRSLAWSTTAWGSAFFLSFLVGFALDANSSLPLADTIAGSAGPFLLAIGPAAMALGALRPDLVDVRGLVTEAVVALTVGTVFVAVVGGLAAATEWASGVAPPVPMVLVMAAVAAFGVHRLSRLLRGIVDQLLFGDRPDPIAAATAVADNIGDDPALALRAVREALVLPYASLVVDGVPLATTGTETPHTRTLPLNLAGTQAALVVGLRPGDLRLGPDDEAVLRIVAPLLAQTLRAQSMAADLAESRGAVIAAIEDERRRLRRDLHDGVGPSLTGVAFTADAARNRLDQDPDVARELLVKLRSDTADAIVEIRRLVDGLRPATLDELGLEASIRQFAAGMHAAGGRAIDVDVVTSGDLGELPAAVEVVAYRIVVEALTNAVRHTAANSVDVVLAVDDGRLIARVSDNGGLSDRWSAGSGLSSMRERAEQVQGALSAGPGEAGEVVEVVLPL